MAFIIIFFVYYLKGKDVSEIVKIISKLESKDYDYDKIYSVSDRLLFFQRV